MIDGGEQKTCKALGDPTKIAKLETGAGNVTALGGPRETTTVVARIASAIVIGIIVSEETETETRGVIEIEIVGDCETVIRRVVTLFREGRTNVHETTSGSGGVESETVRLVTATEMVTTAIRFVTVANVIALIVPGIARSAFLIVLVIALETA